MIPLLITCAINSEAPFTKLNNKLERLNLTIKSIEKWSKNPKVKSLVICDGSGFDLRKYIDNVLKNTNIKYEVICFNNNAEAVRKYGKGYGEGEIINYALKNSSILKNSNSFAKCTGKLWVKNYDKCISSFNGLAFFDYHGKFKIKIIDTRFYIVNKEYFNSFLSKLYNNVNDYDGIYLEHAYSKHFQEVSMYKYIACPVPVVMGVSGSTGEDCAPNSIRILIKNLKHSIVKLGSQFFSYFPTK